MQALHAQVSKYVTLAAIYLRRDRVVGVVPAVGIPYCAEFLVHGVENEGKRCGILDDLVALLAHSPIPVTYAGTVEMQ